MGLYKQETVAFANGDVHLTGRLTLPLSPVPCPALVFVHGSGPGLRDTYLVEADLLARHGIASLGFDKRGCGESTGDWHPVDFDVLADDVLAAVQCLRRDPRIRADKVGLFGISQAGWIIPLAASRSAYSSGRSGLSWLRSGLASRLVVQKPAPVLHAG